MKTSDQKRQKEIKFIRSKARRRMRKRKKRRRRRRNKKRKRKWALPHSLLQYPIARRLPTRKRLGSN